MFPVKPTRHYFISEVDYDDVVGVYRYISFFVSRYVLPTDINDLTNFAVGVNVMIINLSNIDYSDVVSKLYIYIYRCCTRKMLTTRSRFFKMIN